MFDDNVRLVADNKRMFVDCQNCVRDIQELKAERGASRSPESSVNLYQQESTEEIRQSYVSRISEIIGQRLELSSSHATHTIETLILEIADCVYNERNLTTKLQTLQSKYEDLNNEKSDVMKEFSELREDNRRMFDDNARLVVDNKSMLAVRQNVARQDEQVPFGEDKSRAELVEENEKLNATIKDMKFEIGRLGSIFERSVSPSSRPSISDSARGTTNSEIFGPSPSHRGSIISKHGPSIKEITIDGLEEERSDHLIGADSMLSLEYGAEEQKAIDTQEADGSTGKMIEQLQKENMWQRNELQVLLSELDQVVSDNHALMEDNQQLVQQMSELEM